MTSPSTENSPPLLIREKESFSLGDYQIEIIAYLGLLTADVYYFKVKFQPIADLDGEKGETSSQLGLLRVGSLNSSLDRELQLRKILQNYSLLAPLIADIQVDSAIINSLSIKEKSQEVNEKQNEDIAPEQIVSENSGFVNITSTKDDDSGENPSTETDYLEEEYYPETAIENETKPEKLLLLTRFPQENLTLEAWLKEEHSQEEALTLVIQVCQLFSYIAKQNWYLINLLPQFIEIDKPLKIFDLTCAYSIEESLTSGIIGDYCAPELAASRSINESMSSYTIAALLYQTTHQKLPQSDQIISLEIDPIPHLYQLLKIALSSLPEERFPLAQFLSLLIETRQSLRSRKVQWNIASYSTVGLSTERLQNEDNYGVRQQHLSNSETLILGVVADGMGGMSQGEVASQIAVKTILQDSFPPEFKTEEQRNEWLLNLFQKANISIADAVRNGGTTLSVALAINDSLMIAHVGDSRIYLIRQGKIQQLSEDHSLVAMLVANGEITEEESLTHPDRNVLLKSIGSKKHLSEGYVQNLSRTTSNLSMTLENEDILLLCSDGVWDLVPTQELAEIFSQFESLQMAVDQTIQRVINKGATDNATLLALQCFMIYGN